MNSTLPSYDEARIAVRERKDAMSFFNLGLLYAKGIGTAQNNILAQYFLKKALDMGCEEAKAFIGDVFATGEIDFASHITYLLGDKDSASPETIAELKKKIEVERKAKNYGYLSRLRDQLHLFYPEYDKDRAIDDILNGRDTADADIFFATSTADNSLEVYVEMQDKFLQQLYAPVEKQKVFEGEVNTDYLVQTASELVECIRNFTYSYEAICEHFNIEEQEILSLHSLKTFPYIKVSDLFLLRQQALRCLLSVKDVDSTVFDGFLENLCDDSILIDITETIEDKNIKLFLISYIELNIDIETLEIESLRLYRAYKRNYLEPLVEHLNAFAERMKSLEVELNLPVYTTETLPPIDLSR